MFDDVVSMMEVPNSFVSVDAFLRECAKCKNHSISACLRELSCNCLTSP
jgi:hypothetical protein